MKKALIIIGSIFLFLFLTILLIPILFKDKIKTILLEEISKNVNAKVSFDDLSLSLIRNFPNFTVGLDGMSVIGIQEFEGDTLIAAKEFKVVVDVMSVVSGDKIKVKGILLDAPIIHVIKLKNGKANYDIYKALPDKEPKPEEEQKPSKFSIGIEQWQIANGNITYSDQTIPIYTSIFNLNHDGTGDFTQDIFDLNTKTTIQELTVEMDTVSYLSRKSIDVKLVLNMDMPNSKYTFKDNVFKVNEFALGLNGWVQMKGDDILTDVTFNAKETAFKNILSLVPGVFTKDFNDLKTDGTLAFDGFAKGTYNKSTIPTFGLNLLVNNGSFQYPKLPTPVKNVNVDLHLDNKDGILDNTIVNLKKFHVDMGSNPIDATLLLKGLKKYDIDATLLAKLNLGELTQIFPIEGQTIKGSFDINAKAKGVYDSASKRMPALDLKMAMKNGYVKSSSFPEAMENINFSGTVTDPTGTMKDLKVVIENFNMLLAGDPINARATVENMEDYTYDFSVKGKIDLAKMTKIYPLKDMTMAGIINADVNTKGKMSLISAKKYDQLPTSGTISIQSFNFVSKDLPQGFKITSANMVFDPQKINLTNFDGYAGKSNIKLSGYISNYLAYVLKDETIQGSMSLSSPLFDTHEWMTEDKNAPAEDANKPASKPVEIPKNIDFVLKSDIGKVLYDNLEITNLVGNIILKEGVFKMDNVNFNLLDGKFNTTLAYDSREINLPKFNAYFDIKDLSIQKAYASFETIQKMVPAAKNVEGNFSLNINMMGNMDQTMKPVYPSLNGSGMVSIANAIVKSPSFMQAINKVTKLGGVSDQYNLRDTKIKVALKDGRVFAEPFDLNAGNMKFNIGGSQGIDQSLDYNVKTDIPTGALGQAAGNLLGNITGAKAGKIDKIKMNLKVTGFSDSPKVSILSTSAEGGSGNVVDNAKSAVVDKAKAEAERLKQEAEQRARAEADRLAREAVERARKEAEQRGQQEALKRAEEAAKKLKIKKPF